MSNYKIIDVELSTLRVLDPFMAKNCWLQVLRIQTHCLRSVQSPLAVKLLKKRPVSLEN